MNAFHFLGSGVVETKCWKAMAWPGGAGAPGVQTVLEGGSAAFKNRWRILKAHWTTPLLTMSGSIAVLKVWYTVSCDAVV